MLNSEDREFRRIFFMVLAGFLVGMAYLLFIIATDL